MGLAAGLWPWQGRRGGESSTRRNLNNVHDNISYHNREGELLSIPQAERYSSSDWLHNIRTMPTSIILCRIKM
jgi:hypothetical protein